METHTTFVVRVTSQKPIPLLTINEIKKAVFSKLIELRTKETPQGPFPQCESDFNLDGIYVDIEHINNQPIKE